MTADSGRAAYDAWHASLDVDAAADDPWHQLVRRELAPVRDIANRRILEVACGRGGFSCWLATQSPPPREIVAVDYSSVAVEKARAHGATVGAERITWQTGDIQSLAHDDQSFDTVISCETIEHVPDPRTAVRELARVLKPGGKLFLTTPNYLGPFGLYRAYLRLRGRRYREAGQPINQFTVLPRTVRWLRQAGLRPGAIRGVGHYLLSPGRQPRRIRWLDREILKWLALHVIVVAEKPAAGSTGRA